MVSGEEAFMEHIIGMRNLSHDIFQCGFSMTLALVYWTVNGLGYPKIWGFELINCWSMIFGGVNEVFTSKRARLNTKRWG